MIPVLALLTDSLRSLRARKLFWFTILLSALITIAFGSIGFNDRGVTVLFGWKTIETDYIHAGTPWADALYEGIFSAFIVNIWLAWGAIVLALISTASIFPDFLEGGSIDLVLSKPVSRPTIFVTKFVGAVLFVALQTFVFCLGAFLVIRLRLGDWRWMIFIAVPLVTLMFSYLYSVVALVGVWSRSTLAGLTAGLIFWFALFGLQSTNDVLTQIRVQNEQTLADAQELAHMRRSEAAKRAMQGDEAGAERWRRLAEVAQTDIDETEETLAELQPWDEGFDRAAAWLPKTQATIDLVQRALEADREATLTDIMLGRVEPAEEELDLEEGRSNRSRERLVTEQVVEEKRSESPWFILASSAGFELLPLGLALIIFMRRDF
ncbi:MAG: hypothetical protein ACF8PN_10340 [Phycisphaerales bacterium]